MKKKRISLRNLAGLIIVWLCLQVSAQSSEGPEANNYLRGKFVWADLMTSNPSAAMDFYGELLGWRFEAQDDGSYVALNKDRKIAGVVYNNKRFKERSQNQWVSYISSSDPDLVAVYVKNAGGQVLVDAVDVEGRGRMAIFVAPDDAIFGVINFSTGDPPDDPAEPGDFIWYELWSTDTAASVKFYEYLKYTVWPNPGPNGSENFILSAFGFSRAGIVQGHEGQKNSGWLPYIRVHSVEDTIKKTIALGGSQPELKGAPNSEYPVALLVDPTGGAFAVFEWVESEQEDENE
jgi:predicted enzyme related to lactoylglutathione lyase